MQGKPINLSIKLLNGLAVMMGLLISILPTAIVALPKGASVVVLMLILSLLGLVLNREKLKMSRWEKYFIFSFIFYFVLMAMNVWWFNSDLKNLDTLSRLILVLPIFFYIRKSNINFNWFIWSVVIAAFAISINQMMFHFSGNGLYSFQTGSGNVTLYASILGLMCLFFINRNKSIIFNLIFTMAAALSIVASLLAGGRGVWISAVLSIVVIMFVNSFNWSKKVRVLPVLGIVGILFVAYLTPQTGVKVRIDNAVTNVISWAENGKSNTSSGVRLEMWRASYEIIKENPMIGVGKGNYKEHVQVLVNQGKVDEIVASFDHPHNEYITNFLELGIVGLLALILVFLSPISYFLNTIKHHACDQQERVLAVAGLILVLHYSFYSLTAGVFAHQSTTLFYSIFLVIIIGLSTALNKNKIVQSSNP
jgi:O-antigen ligase